MIASDILDRPIPGTAYQRASWPYELIRWLFTIILRVFYSEVVVENEELLPANGVPTILVANHSNSLVDPALLISHVKKRTLLRLTAKDTHFRQRTLSSWLIEKAGALPIQRQKDHLGSEIATGNAKTFQRLVESLTQGDCLALFPEGISRHHPKLAPFKTGVARIASAALTANADDPHFRLYIAPCAITYLHRFRFRSNVCVSFGAPVILSVATHPELIDTPEKPLQFEAVRRLTQEIEGELRSGTLDAPSWQILRASHTARRLYAPLDATAISIGDYIRLTQIWCDYLSNATRPTPLSRKLKHQKRPSLSRSNTANTGMTEEDIELTEEEAQDGIEVADVQRLVARLERYQDQLGRLGLKDHRISSHAFLPLWRLLLRLSIRATITGALGLLCLTVLPLWAPIFYFTKRAEIVYRNKTLWDSLDELGQAKALSGLASGAATWALVCLLTWPLLPFTFWLVPLFMWWSLGWVEAFVASARSTLSIAKLIELRLTKPHVLLRLHAERSRLAEDVMQIAVTKLGLPPSHDELFPDAALTNGHAASQGGKVRGRRRRALAKRLRWIHRRKDWNETLRLWDVVDYEQDELERLPTD
ncbi:uncharacterized protein L969DRAFT_19729 [Mixia osmundae IAM 14324]|uniref:uncharacterized protein n=1 Tax=Mixia osmundae (strain CBS 9802 / IAM 14324 / JCM 22182 / KY 12970) TaxID=764103 RepID=UPI0004A54955|nr:uncharacterized protein L969DRAFT_19729 [Mixia osmundae IAM 14324]KEI37194.1 hypothetical protein L969DRAFT_19729 [Mixia osmundae IAM 14324]